MIPVVLQYTEKLKEDLIKFDIEFSHDEVGESSKLITTFIPDITYDGEVHISEFLPSILPIIKSKKLSILKHASLNEINISHLNGADFFLTGFYSSNSSSSMVSIHYDVLSYNKSEEKNKGSQYDCITYKEKPKFCIAINDDNEKPIAYLGYNIIHICFDFFHCTKLSNLHKKFLSDIVNLYIKAEKQLETLFRDYFINKTKNDFINYLKSTHETKKHTYERNINTLEAEIKEYNKQITNHYKSLRENILILDELSKTIPDFEEEIEEIIKLFRVEFNENHEIIVFTDEIIINETKIGRFKIKINYDNGSILILNLDRKCEIYDHPHIRNGNMCFGDMLENINKLIAEGKFLELSSLIVELLYFYNPSSAYRSIDEWTRYDELHKK